MTQWARWFGVLARLVVGGVWIAAGLLKLPDPAENIRAVRAYDLLPESLVQLVGYSLPTFELVLGIALVLGLLTRWTGLLSGLLLVAFVIGISSAWARGLSIECGCFGGGGGPAEGAKDKYPWELARDAGLLLLSAYLVWRPRTPWALDNLLVPEVPPVPAVPAAETGKGGSRAARTRAAQQAAEIRRAAAAKEQGRRNNAVTAVVLAGMLAVVAVGYGVQSNRDTTGQQATVPSGVVDTYALPVGKADAPVQVDVYEDFLCPFCQQFEAATRDMLAGYVSSGDVQVRYHVIAFLDRASTTDYSTRAMNALGVVLDTAGPEVAKKFHDALYENQPAEGSAGLPDAKLIELAVQAGADEAQVATPIKDRKFGAWVKNATDAASRQGVNSTPTVLVDGRMLPQDTMSATVAALEAAIKSGIGG